MNYSGNNRRGRIAIADHTHPLVRIFMAQLNEQQTTFAEVADRSKVGVDTLRFWQRRHMPRLDLFEAALNAIDLELCIRHRGGNRSIINRDPVRAALADLVGRIDSGCDDVQAAVLRARAALAKAAVGPAVRS